MLLDKSNRSVVLLLGAVHTTSPLDITSHYEDEKYKDQLVIPVTEFSISNGVTPAPIISAPDDNTARKIQEIIIFNRDTITHTVTVYILDNATVRRQVVFSLATLKTLMYNIEKGWFAV